MPTSIRRSPRQRGQRSRAPATGCPRSRTGAVMASGTPGCRGPATARTGPATTQARGGQCYPSLASACRLPACSLPAVLHRGGPIVAALIVAVLIPAVTAAPRCRTAPLARALARPGPVRPRTGTVRRTRRHTGPAPLAAAGRPGRGRPHPAPGREARRVSFGPARPGSGLPSRVRSELSRGARTALTTGRMGRIGVTGRMARRRRDITQQGPAPACPARVPRRVRGGGFRSIRMPGPRRRAALMPGRCTRQRGTRLTGTVRGAPAAVPASSGRAVPASGEQARPSRVVRDLAGPVLPPGAARVRAGPPAGWVTGAPASPAR